MPCAESPSDCASRTAAGPIAASAPGVSRASVVRLRKSSTESPDENRAERAVGDYVSGPNHVLPTASGVQPPRKIAPA